MASLYPLVWLGRGLAAWSASIWQMDRHDLASSELRITSVVNEVLVWLLAQETRLIACRRHLPTGTSLVAVARRLSRE